MGDETRDIDQLLTLSVVEALKNKGFNQSEIARMYGITREFADITDEGKVIWRFPPIEP